MRTYNIIFIDDEKIIRDSFLKLINWTENNFKVGGTFKDGKTALEYLSKNQVDIMVSDINMPFLNGIELLKYIRSQNMKTRVILLTGYEYFEYASKALQFKAFDFLLKPITTEKLFQAVWSAAYDIEKEEISELNQAQCLERAQGEFLNKLFYDKITKSDLKKEAVHSSIPVDASSYLTMKVAIDAVDGKLISEDEVSEIKKKVTTVIQEKKNEIELKYLSTFDLYFAENMNVHLLMLLVNRQEKEFCMDTISAFAESILIAEGGDARYTVTVGVGKPVTQLEKISDSFQEVSKITEKRHIAGTGKVFFTSEETEHKQDISKIVLPTDTLLEDIRMGMTEEVRRTIRGVYNSFRHKEYISLDSVKMVTTELALTIFKAQADDSSRKLSYLSFLNQIQKLNTLEEMEKCITKLAVHIIQQRIKGASHKAQIAEQAIDYLKKNYANDELSLNDVATYLNISIPYLAVVFKQETDQNFSAHLLQIRMEKAKEYLKTTAMSVSEIADKVGYSSQQYFSVCFKKYTGLSPVNYKNQ